MEPAISRLICCATRDQRATRMRADCFRAVIAHRVRDAARLPNTAKNGTRFASPDGFENSHLLGKQPMIPSLTGAEALAPDGTTAFPACGTAAVPAADPREPLGIPGVNGAPRSQSKARSATLTTWSRARSWVAGRPAASMAASFVAGGIVGWLTSKLR